MSAYFTRLQPLLILLFVFLILISSAGFADARPVNTRYDVAQGNTAGGEKTGDTETLSSILENYQNAIGGQTAWKKLNTLKITGNMQSLGTVFKSTVVYKRPNMCRIDFNADGMTFIESFDGTTPWQVGMVGNTRSPVPLEGKRAQELKQTCDFDGPLVDHKKKRLKLEYEGKDEVKGRAAFKIKVAYENETVDTYYLDEKTYLPFMVKGTTSIQNKTIKSTTLIDDFIQTGDIRIPYYYEFELEGVPTNEIFKVSTVELNPEVKDDLFSMQRNVKDSY